ncbi:PDZ and LIM domain protein 2 [Monodelphis domestica]|uniref:PDZ and LIM domain protein 2 n=1 Tax=Monodelphis domestica TaxID=13616 RepID=UPI0024E1C55E|nr:PDZ and LIM domain protein 2 [Monodelphis domestica]XP_056669673.1 PDZ and LIM domain protein 2 [Monodelphis domestica]
MALTVDVIGPAPWGFRITGGRDFHMPIVVSKVTERGKAEAADLRPGDVIVAINGESAGGMLHAEAQSKIRQSPSPLRLQLDRSRASSPGQANGGSPLEWASCFQNPTRTRTDSQTSLRSSYSSPASLSPPPSRSSFSTPPPATFHTLPGEVVTGSSFQSLSCSPAEHLSSRGQLSSRQAGLGRAGDSAVWVLPPSPGGFRGSQPSSPKRSLSPKRSVDFEGGGHLLEEDSEVFKMLQENLEARTAPRQSSSFRMLQEALEAEEKDGTSAFLPSSLSPLASRPAGATQTTPPRLHICEKCNTNITNQAVRIQDGRYRHPGCYTCLDCGLNLKMRGHFWVGDELYCEKHARQRYAAQHALSAHS